MRVKSTGRIYIRKTVHNKHYLLFIVLLYFFLFKNVLENLFPFLGYVDEIIAALALLIWAVSLMRSGMKLRLQKGLGGGTADM